MMSLLSVTVKKAHFIGPQASQFNTYVTLKLQNVKSTTVTVKGATPCWEQDFLFETNDLNTGLLIEVWSKGMLWDRAMGYHYIPLQTVHYSNEESCGQWLPLEADLLMSDGEVIGTENATGHSLLVDFRFELPFGPCDPPNGWKDLLQSTVENDRKTNEVEKHIDPENIEASELQRKLEMLNNIMDQEQRAEQARRQMQFVGNSGYSEDSDYTSDLNYPVGQHANSSASQFRAAAHQMATPQRSLETSRENSYEREDGVGHHHHQQQYLPQPPITHQHHLSPGSISRKMYSPNADDFSSYGSSHTDPSNRAYYQENNIDSEPLFYNSRPRNKKDYSSQDNWISCDSNFYNQSVDSIDVGYSGETDYYSQKKINRGTRRPSLERQTTLYDDNLYSESDNIYHNPTITQVNYVHYNSQNNPYQNTSFDEYYDSSSAPFQQEMYGQDEEDRQWDSGGYSYKPPSKTPGSKKLPTIPTQSKRQLSFVNNDSFYSVYEEGKSTTPTLRRKMPQVPTKRSASRQSSIDRLDAYQSASHRGKSLPPTPTKTSQIIKKTVNLPSNFNSLPPTPGRQLPKPNLNHRSAKMKRNGFIKRTSSAECAEDLDRFNNVYYGRPGANSAVEMYNEDYNYAYQSIEDNLPDQHEISTSKAPTFPLGTTTDVGISKSKEPQIGYEPYDVYYSPQEEYASQGYFDQTSQLSKKDSTSIRNDLQEPTTNSLESRDDDFRNSFDTAISSGGTSMMNRSTYSEYANAGDASMFYANSAPVKTENQMQYQRDQILSPPKAIPDQSSLENSSNQTSVTVAQIHNENTAAIQSRGFFKQQETIEEEYYDKDDEYVENDDITSYLPPQDSVETYVEEEMASNGYKEFKKAINQDSPVSVIHVDSYEDNQSLRRGSSQVTVIDPYHPSIQRPPDEAYVPMSRRGSMIPDAYAINRRVSGELYDDSANAVSSRKPSVESYQSGFQQRCSIRQKSPSNETIPEQPPTIEVTAPGPLENDGVVEKKTLSFEEEDKGKRPQVTAQQRWLWAYNKIIMQINVSRIQFLLNIAKIDDCHQDCKMVEVLSLYLCCLMLK